MNEERDPALIAPAQGVTCHACGFICPPGTNFCGHCGQHLRSPVVEGWVVQGIDLRHVARWQRRLLWYLLALLMVPCTYWILPNALGALPMTTTSVLAAANGVLYLAAYVLVAVGVVGMLKALKKPTWMLIVYALLMIAPCVNYLMLLIANAHATTALRLAGLHVGFMGVKDADVVRLLSRYACHRCGYSLVGNTSGTCPECGTPSHIGFAPGQPPG